MLDLVDNGGCEIAAAVAAMRMGFTTHWLKDYPLTKVAPKNDTWLAIASISYPAGDEYTISTEYLAGGYHDIPRLVQGIGESVSETTGLLERVEVFEGEFGPDFRTVKVENPGYAPSRIIMANASLAARKVIQEVTLLDIALTDDDFPTFPQGAYGAMSSRHSAVKGWTAYVKRIEGKAD